MVGNTLLGNPTGPFAEGDEFGTESKFKTSGHRLEPNGQSGFRERKHRQTPAGLVIAIITTAPKTMKGPKGTSALRLR